MSTFRRFLVTAVCLAVSGLATAADRITVEDLLNGESLDSSWSGSAFSPDGRSLAYTVNTAASRRPTWGYEAASLQTMARVFVTTGGSEPREIRGTSTEFYSLAPVDAWSPDGKSLLLIATARERYGLARYEPDGGGIARIPGRIANSFIPTFAWLPDGRIAYATIPDDERQSRAGAQTLNGIASRWGSTWNAEPAAVTVHSANPVFAATEPRPGALMLAGARDGSTYKIADGDYVSLAASPSGRHLGAVASGALVSDPLNWNGRLGELRIFALSANAAKPVPVAGGVDVVMYGGLSWSPSGRNLLVVGRPTEAKTRETRLYVVDPASGKQRALDTPGLSFVNPDPAIGTYPAGWLGEHVVAIAAHEAKNATGLFASSLTGAGTLEYGQGNTQRTDLFAFTKGKPENLTAFAKGPVSQFATTGGGTLLTVVDGALWQLQPGRTAKRLTPESAQVLAFGTDRRNPPLRAQTAYYREGRDERVSLSVLVDGKPARRNFDFPTGKLEALPASGDIVVSAPDRRTVLARTEDGWTSSFVLDDGTPHPLAAVNANLKGKAVADVEKFDYTAGGRKLNGFVLWPPGVSADTRLPAVVSVYGGMVYGDQPPPHARPAIEVPAFSGQLLAAEGYAVVYASTPLGRGADSDQPAQLAEAVVAAIDALAAKGRIDPQRVGVMGQSYGGFSTAALLAQRSDRFKAGVSLAGLYDFFHAWGMRSFEEIFSDQGLGTAMAKFVEEGQGQLGKPFWHAPEAYIRMSPIFHVDTLDAPLLMLHGDLDMGGTDLAGAERMYTALLRAGKKPALVHYWGEGHVAQSGAAMRDQWTRITAWFGHYLKGEPISP